MALNLVTISDSRLKSNRWAKRDSLRRIRLYGLSLVLIGLFFITGCDTGYIAAKSIPTPIPEKFPYEIQGASATAIWGGDNFEAMHNGLLHYLVLQGIDSPKPGQDYFGKSRKHMKALIRRRPLRAVLYELDEEKREIARVYIDDLDVNLEMVRAGMAWFDGNEFEDSESFRLAEKEAREQKIGLWQTPEPVHPSEFQGKIEPKR